MAKILLENMNTEVIPVANFGTYWGGLNYVLDDVFDYSCIDLTDYDPEEIGESAYQELVRLVNEEYTGADDFYRAVVSIADDTIQTAFDEYGIPARVIPGTCKWNHPRSFNFRDSRMEFDMEIDADWVEDTFMELQNDPDFIEFIEEHFTSRDGFFSYMPNNPQDLEEMLSYTNPQYWKLVSELIQYIISQDPDIYDHVTDNMVEELESSGEFITFRDLGIYR